MMSPLTHRSATARRISVGIAILLLGLAAISVDRWWPLTQHWGRPTITAQPKSAASASHAAADGSQSVDHDHGDHGHGHDDANSLALSPQAMGNIGLTPEHLKPIQPETYLRSITVPAIVVERPGRTRIQVSTPMAGVITHVHAVRGEATSPGSLLFEIRITADELVSTQTELLKTLGGLEVEDREIERLESVTKTGAVAQKTLLERQYAKDKLEVLLAAQKEALRLQGLSDRQVQDIVTTRRLLRDLQIRVPDVDQHSDDELELSDGADPHPDETSRVDLSSTTALADTSHPAGPLLILQDVMVSKGERVSAGATLAVLSDMSELYLEGLAFEQDASLLATATANDWKVTALLERSGQVVEVVPGLDLLYAASDVNPQSRTLPFYVRLPNLLIRDVPSPNGLRFIEWKYRPGQRLQIRVPVEQWQQQIVLPVDAIAEEGAETFVFQQNGNHFDRIPVHVVYRDQSHAVIKQDGSLFFGDVVALRGAHQMQMALKNKSGGGVDPHAGHNH